MFTHLNSKPPRLLLGTGSVTLCLVLDIPEKILLYPSPLNKRKEEEPNCERPKNGEKIDSDDPNQWMFMHEISNTKEL